MTRPETSDSRRSVIFGRAGRSVKFDTATEEQRTLDTAARTFCGSEKSVKRTLLTFFALLRFLEEKT